MDLSTTYMGMNLKNPLVPSAAAPISRNLDTVRKLEDAGASAIVMFSLFEEQITHEVEELDYYLLRSSHSYAEAITYFPDLDHINLGPHEYMEHVARVKQAVDIPVIGSLNGVSLGGWTDYARQIEEAGADALEINLYFIPADPDLTGAEVEKIYTDVLTDVKKIINIPVAIKISPFFSSMFDMAKKLVDAGADALVLFNRFLQPDIDLENLEVKPSLVLSTPIEIRLPLRWIAILYGHLGNTSLALTRGVHDAESALKGIMVGADVTMICSQILRSGPSCITKILRDMEAWMEEHEYDSIEMMKGSMSQRSCAEPAAFERANYMKVLQSYDRFPTL